MEFQSILQLPAALTAILFTFLGSDPAPAEGGEDITSKPAAIEAYAALSEAITDSERFWTAPFVLADLEKQEVYVLGEFSGMIPGEPLEFYVISEMSGHEYESLMVSYALPSDINEAMLKIGLSPIGPVDPDQHRFWPRGDRVQPRFYYADETGTIQEAHQHDICLWKGAPFPDMPWVFTSAPTLPALDGSGEMVFSPDGMSPNSIASTFNLVSTVFDLPLQGSKTSVYGNFLLSPQWNMAEGRGMIMKLAPAPPGSFTPERNLTVTLSTDGASLQGLEGVSTRDLAEVGSALNAREEEIQYLTFDFSEDLTLAEATERAREIQLLSQHVPSMRIDPPPPGQVFYQSFVPDPKFRIRTQRPSQPLELHITDAGVVLKELKELWTESRVPEIEEKEIPLASPGELTSYVEGKASLPSVLFLYADPTLPLKEMRQWTQPVLDHFPIVFVYTSQGE